ncbi:HAD family hydrolase [bacterium]|nr:HAD family hydrolase [bacterium]
MHPMTDRAFPARQYDLVIFDFDGTLADSYQWFLSVFDEIVERYSLPRLEQSELRQLRKVDIRQISRQFNIPLWKIVQIGSHLQKKMASQIDKVLLVDGMQAVLDGLAAAGIRMAVVTSNAEENVKQVLGPHNVERFEAFEAGVTLYGKKAKFEKVLKKTGANPIQVLSVGDELRDLKASHQAGIAFGAVAWGATEMETFRTHNPDLLFAHPDDILNIVLNRLDQEYHTKENNQ